MFTIKHYPKRGGGFRYSANSCSRFVVHDADDDKKVTVSMWTRHSDQPEFFHVAPGDTLYVENDAGRTVDTVRVAEPA